MPDLDRADSVTVDPHKWFFQAYDIGGLMVRRGEHLASAFGGQMPEYYRGGDRLVPGEAHAGAARTTEGHPTSPSNEVQTDDGHSDVSAGHLNFWKLGFEGTRRFRALKLWLSWKHLGSAGFGRLIEANIDLAAHLARRIAASDDFEALPENPPLSVVCFRHLPAGLSPDELDAHQDCLQAALEASGDGWLSTTRLRGSTYLRVGIMNTQADGADVDALLERLRQLAADL
jgi:glutamate/tyrosine decarboxylase-like PLP-dependent enzyme